MKERPIIMNREMVRAVLEGRKTQTRRPLKPQPINGWEFGTASEFGIKLGWIKSSHPRKGKFGVFTRREWTDGKFEHDIITCPFGQPGDRLWVRETCKAEELESGLDGVRYAADDAFLPIQDTKQAAEDWLVLSTYRKKKYQHGQSNTVPSIHMPRWASRILLEITDIRVERLWDIAEPDILAEGVKKRYGEFKELWDSVYGKEAWARNDWVWVIEFKVVEIKQ